MSQVREQRDFLLYRLPRLRLVFVVLLVLVAGRFWFVQAVRGDYYRELADNNRMREVTLKAPRGLIYERQGHLLVENVPAYNLMLDRSRSDDLRRSVEFASATLQRPIADLESAIESQKGRSVFQPILIAEGLSLSEVSRFSVSTLEYPEFEIDAGHLRLYRYGPMMAHLVGYLGEVGEDKVKQENSLYRSGDLIGKKGVEQTFDRYLRGEDGERTVVVDSRGRLREENLVRQASPGQELELALDLELQQEAARYFADQAGAAVALDPVSGEIRVMLSAPAYNPNLFSRRLDQAAWQNLIEDPLHPLQDRALQSAYSPGSVFKIVMGVAGLTDGLVTPETAVYCPGATRIYNRRFRCWKRGGHGWVKLHRAIKESCDVYFYHLGKDLGISRIAHYARLLGMGKLTGIEIAGEKAGLVPDPQWSLQQRGTPWYPGETISVSIGQGPLLVTPLQMATIMASVANGGYRVTPSVVKVNGSASKQPLGVESTAMQAVSQALWSVVNERGTGTRAKVDGIDVYGKTGTVQVVRQETWIKSEDLPYEKRDHAWFASFAKSANRELVVVVFVEHGGHGSTAAAPLAKRLYEIYFRDDLLSNQSS